MMDILDSCRASSPNDGSHDLHARCLSAADEIESLRLALKWYADGEHFSMAVQDAWDTVSGEPQNWWADEAGTAMVEDGTLAGMVLSGNLTGQKLAALEDGDEMPLDGSNPNPPECDPRA